MDYGQPYSYYHTRKHPHANELEENSDEAEENAYQTVRGEMYATSM